MDNNLAKSHAHGIIWGLLWTIGLLILELILTMLVYTGLNIWSLNLFGALVRMVQPVQDLMRLIVERLLPGAANTAYATLFGELGPKSILLLVIGLIVAAIVRGVVGLVHRR